MKNIQRGLYDPVGLFQEEFVAAKVAVIDKGDMRKWNMH